MGKVTGKPIGEAHGITITVSHKPAKTTKGKNRLWLQIRQNNGKPWKVYQTLAYTRGVDVAFVNEPE